ncbi:glycosyltransferase family 4 protein [Uliginosibacterium sp. sgz301328]|uniref:MraY family glycosyltransferase n=1 Tax=Uliginosibacterium sp. sgz301328 TaxID=3243764 RepID=UPI00359E2BC1
MSALVVGVLLRTGLAWRIATDHPNARSMHTRVTPRVGGLGVMAAVLLAVALAPADLTTRVLGALALGLCVMSLIDDRHGLPVRLRFGAHCLTAALAVWGTGMYHMGWAWAFAAGLVCVWMTNLYNFMDGSDGMAGGMALIGFGALAVAAPSAGIGTMAAMTACGALGFLYFNWHPARIFMGDCGSVPLGFLAAALGMHGVAGGAWPWWFAPWVFSPFIMDATATLVRRGLRGERVWQAHREHYYQRAIRMGAGHARVAAGWYAAMLVAAATALHALSHGSAQLAFALAGIVTAIFVIVALAIDIRWRRHQSKQDTTHA